LKILPSFAIQDILYSSLYRFQRGRLVPVENELVALEDALQKQARSPLFEVFQRVSTERSMG
jgi:hypothetical protein